MLKKITYVFLGCLFFIQAQSQHLNTVRRLIGNITTNISTIHSDSKIPDSCKKNIERFKNPQLKLDTTGIQSLMDSITALKSFAVVAKKNCKDGKLQKLIDSTGKLITELGYLKDSLKNADKNSIIDTNAKNKIAIPPAISSEDSSNQTPSRSNSSVFATENRFLLISVSLLFVLTLVIIILYVKTHRALRTAIRAISELTNKSEENQSDMKEKSINFVDPQPAETKEEPPMPESVPVIITTDKPNNKPYFICEAMMTAGPRKDDNADVDLGEDVCGFIYKENEVLIWILDGTSYSARSLNWDKDTREYFSGRLLAQCIADKLRKNFTENVVEPLNEIIKKIIQEVISEWQKTIDTLPPDKSKLLKEYVEEYKSVQCSTTILIGKLSIEGDFTAYRSGDSKMLLFAASSPDKIGLVETSLEEKNEGSDDRIFFALELKNGSVHINSNNDKLQYETITEKNINAVISYSDGIGTKTAYFLKQEYKNDPGKARKEIAYHLQETQDDKSICFIEIKQNGKP